MMHLADPRQFTRSLSYVLLPGTKPPRDQQNRYAAAYALWRSVWLDTLKELDGAEELASDDFTRQDDIGAVFQGNDCLMLSFFRELDARQPASRHDSYFKVWPDEAYRQLDVNGRVLVGSNITVAPAVRRTRETPIAMKDLLVGLCMQRFLATGAGAMTGTMRNNKGMNECAYRHGGRPLLKEHQHHGVAVDLVGFYRDSVKPCGITEVDEAVAAIWQRHLDATHPMNKAA